MTTLQDIEHAITIARPRTVVWTAMTEAGLVEEWLGCLNFRPEIGATFYMQPDPARRAAGDIAGATHCELEALDAPARMRFSWFMPGTPKTHVELTLREDGPQSTSVRLVHTGWDQFDADQIRAIRDMLDGGWSSYVLPGLKRTAETARA